ncbi:hypothetical protein FQN54_004972 [Arachnomyces sp. PD_36]|nr:hypothetical protein FQN54_004972 [Arachnomyces sp. PD_36]
MASSTPLSQDLGFLSALFHLQSKSTPPQIANALRTLWMALITRSFPSREGFKWGYFPYGPASAGRGGRSGVYVVHVKLLDDGSGSGSGSEGVRFEERVVLRVNCLVEEPLLLAGDGDGDGNEGSEEKKWPEASALDDGEALFGAVAIGTGVRFYSRGDSGRGGGAVEGGEERVVKYLHDGVLDLGGEEGRGEVEGWMGFVRREIDRVMVGE